MDWWGRLLSGGGVDVGVVYQTGGGRTFTGGSAQRGAQDRVPAAVDVVAGLERGAALVGRWFHVEVAVDVVVSVEEREVHRSYWGGPYWGGPGFADGGHGEDGECGDGVHGGC